MHRPRKDEPHGEHPHSALPYLLVWIALMFFTGLTYVTGKQHLGTWALPIALVIAGTKSALVALIFMQLRESSGSTRLVFGTALMSSPCCCSSPWPT